MLHTKFGANRSRRSSKKYVFHLLRFCEGKVTVKVGMAHVDIRFNNVRHIMWEL